MGEGFAATVLLLEQLGNDTVNVYILPELYTSGVGGDPPLCARMGRLPQRSQGVGSSRLDPEGGDLEVGRANSLLSPSGVS